MGDLHALHCQRAFLVITAACIPLYLLSLISSPLLQAIGEDRTICIAAQPFIVCLGLRLFVEGYFTILQRMGQAMGYASVMSILTMVTCLLAPIFLWVFMKVAGLGYIGAAWGADAWYAVNLLFLIAFLLAKKSPGRGRSLFIPYQPLSEVFSIQGLREYLSLALPATLEVCFQRFFVDFCVMWAAGLLPDPAVNLGANAVVQVVDDSLYMIWGGLQAAMSIHVGRYVGAGNARKAKRVICLTICAGLAVAVLMVMLLMLAPWEIAGMLTESDEVKSRAALCLRLLAVFIVFEATGSMLSGALRGIGRQKRAAQFQLIGFYGVGLPLGVIWMLTKKNDVWGLVWLWAVVGSAVTVCVICNAIYILRLDWQLVLIEARERNH